MKTKDYSIWLVPEEKSFDKFSSIISRLSKKYNTPNFVPHVTLLGEVGGTEQKIIDKTKLLSKKISPYTLYFSNPAYEDFYFRALFLKAKENAKVIKANKVAREVFKIKGKTKYEPHLSLLYGDLSQKIKQNIVKNFKGSFPKKFKVNKIFLYKTVGEVDSWKEVISFNL